MAGTAYITCSNGNNSQSLVYNFALHYNDGGDSGVVTLAADGTGYPPSEPAADRNTMSIGVATVTNKHTFSVNTAGPNFVLGSTGVLVNLTLFLGASNVPLTVTRP